MNKGRWVELCPTQQPGFIVCYQPELGQIRVNDNVSFKSSVCGRMVVVIFSHSTTRNGLRTLARCAQGWNKMGKHQVFDARPTRQRPEISGG